MAKNDNAVQMENKAKAEANSKPKVTRKQLTPAERIARAEAELKALRAKADEKEAKAKAEARVKRDALVVKRDALNAQILELNLTIGDTEPAAVENDAA